MTTSPVAPNAVDLTGLEQLRRSAARNDKSAVAEAAVQFEALFIGMMLDSARSANFGGGMFDGPETKQYLELMDRQVALEMARHGGLGFGKLLTQQLAPGTPPRPTGLVSPAPVPVAGATVVDAPFADDGQGAAAALPEASGTVSAEFPAALPPSLAAVAGLDAEDGPSAADAFVAKLLPDAEAAAAALGVEPRVLLAQAALETGWGSAMPQHADGASAHNLFGIKAGPSWNGERTTQWTLEHQDGATARRRADFRAYASPSASFADYVNVIGNTPRYAAALANAADPESYARAVSAAGYATDPGYADKWLSIYHGDRLDNALRRAAGTASAVPGAAVLQALGDLGL